MPSLPVLTVLLSIAQSQPAIPEPCRLSAVGPWSSAGEGYTVQATTDGADCATADLTLALVSPSGRALKEWQWSATVAVRRFYGVPGPSEMRRELEAWISPGEGQPEASNALPAWPEGAARPGRFEPAEGLTREAWVSLQAAARPLFCFDEAPGYQTCVALEADETVLDIGRRATR